MADRSLRGMRLGGQSLQTEEGVVFSPRLTHTYHCPSCGKDTDMVFSAEAEAPDTWECKYDGASAKLVGGAEPAPKKVKPPRTHWDMLLERRSVDDLEEVLTERLDVLKSRRTKVS